MATQKLISIALLLMLLRSPFILDTKKLAFEYIYQFGDSINDTGNLNWDEENTLCKPYPYGISLPDPDLRRCSDGLLMIDYFARFFNLSLNPYLDMEGDFSQGVNFAVSGATALDNSILSEKHILSPFTNNSLSNQLGWFKSHLKSACNGALDCKQRLGKAVIFMGEIGGNDYNYELLMQKPLRELYELVPNVVLAIKMAAKEIINYGAKTMVIAGNFPIGCLPVYLTSFGTDDPSKYDDLNCLKDLNDFATFHNDRIQEAIKELQQDNPHANIVYADYFSALRWLIKRAPSLGFDKNEIQKACCGDGANDYNFNGTRFCGDEGVSVCADPDKRISWDGLHFTQHAYQHMAYWLLNQIIPKIIANNNIQIIKIMHKILSPL